MTRRLLMQSFLALGLVFGFTGMKAQNKKESESKMKIHIQINENGEKKEIKKEFSGSDTKELEELLKELDVLKDLKIEADDERIEIDIKSFKSDDILKDFNIDIDINGLEECMKKMEECKNLPEKAFLGVQYDQAPEGKGLTITRIVEGSAAEKAGLKKGDVITSVDGEDMTELMQLHKAIGEKKPGDKVKIQILRDGKKDNVKAELGKKKYRVHSFSHSSSGNNNFHFDFDTDKLKDQLKGTDMEKYFDKDFKFDTQKFMDDMELNQKEIQEKVQRRMEEANKRGFLGITGGSSDKEGAAVGTVYDKSAAKDMGLQKGDVITNINGTAIKSFDDLREVIGKLEKGADVTIKYDRDGKAGEATGQLKSRMETIGNNHAEHVWKHSFSENGKKSEIHIVIRMEDLTSEEAKDLSEKSGMTVIADPNLEINKVEIGPNPSNGVFNLNFQLANPGTTRVMLMDGAGKLVFEEVLNDFSGEYQKQMDIQNQPNGLYFLMIEQGGKQFNKKIVKQ